MRALFYVFYSLSAYLFFLAVFLYMIAFVAGLPLPRTIDVGPPVPAGEALLRDLLVLAVFGLQHSIMARASFKRLWMRIVPQPIERSTYVLASTLALGLILWQWRPIAEPVVWEFTGTAGWILQCMFWIGWAVMLSSSFMINHFELFGLGQVLNSLMNLAPSGQQFRTPLFYKYVRHPLYTGVLIGFWATPRMTAGHLVFAIGFTAYTLVGIYFEERDLVSNFGARYRDYRQRVGMLLPTRRRTL